MTTKQDQADALEVIRLQFRNLRMWTEIFDDMQAQRISLFNKLGLKADGTPTKDRPNSIDLDPKIYEALVEGATFMESKQAAKIMLGYYREVAPEGVLKWQKDAKGIGEHTVAKLLGYIGHPRIAFPFVWETDAKGKKLAEPTMQEPFERTVAQLWSYCGVGDPSRKRFKGMTQEDALRLGNPRAKKTLWLMAQGIIKANDSIYRDVYNDSREKYADRKHMTDCVRCGPSGKPALVGSDMRDGHKHAIATRAIMKEVLRDLHAASEI